MPFLDVLVQKKMVNKISIELGILDHPPPLFLRMIPKKNCLALSNFHVVLKRLQNVTPKKYQL